LYPREQVDLLASIEWRLEFVNLRDGKA